MKGFGQNEHDESANGIADGISDAMLDMVVDKLIPADVHERFILPMFYRPLEELLPQFGENDVNPAFRVEKAKTRACHVPFNPEYFRTGSGASRPRVSLDSFGPFPGLSCQRASLISWIGPGSSRSSSKRW